MRKVLITGITGFLGSHIAEALVDDCVHVVGLKRPNSDIWRCKGFEEKIDWVDLDDKGVWINTLVRKVPDVIIHAAWIGVESQDRDNWTEQGKNINFLISLLEIAKKVSLDQFLFLGSQAEYGLLTGKISEKENTTALNAYGSIKLASMEILRTFCKLNDINWVWLRVFSLFGEKENKNWLIPSVVSRMTTDKQMDFTKGEQRYAYLYVKDFSKIILQILKRNVPSGVYNVSSNETHQLKSLLEQVKSIVNSNFKLNFGAIPYRANQSMHIEGDISKLKQQIGEIEFTNFNVALNNTINYYLSH